MSGAGLDSYGTIFSMFIQVLGFVDDLDITGRPLRAVPEAFLALEGSTRTLGFIIIESKTNYMATGQETREGMHSQIGTYSVVKVNDCFYLGCQVNTNGENTEEIKRRSPQLTHMLATSVQEIDPSSIGVI